MAIQWFDTKKGLCGCEADKTQVSTAQEANRGRVIQRDPYVVKFERIRSRQVRHWRKRDNAHFWHWEDQASELVGGTGR